MGTPQGAARWRADHHQGEHRHQGRAGAARHRGNRARSRGCRRACSSARARGRRHHPRQDHHAGLRHAVVGPQLLPSADAQSLEPRVESRRLERRGGGRGRCRLRALASRHRHRRLGRLPPAGTASYAGPARPRAGGRRSSARAPADDAHYRRRRSDVDCRSRCARSYEPAAGRIDWRAALEPRPQGRPHVDAAPACRSMPR
jgi:hypothetical protein